MPERSGLRRQTFDSLAFVQSPGDPQVPLPPSGTRRGSSPRRSPGETHYTTSAGRTAVTRWAQLWLALAMIKSTCGGMDLAATNHTGHRKFSPIFCELRHPLHPFRWAHYLHCGSLDCVLCPLIINNRIPIVVILSPRYLFDCWCVCVCVLLYV